MRRTRHWLYPRKSSRGAQLIASRGLSTQSLCSASASVPCCLYNLGWIAYLSCVPVFPCTVGDTDPSLGAWQKVGCSINRTVALISVCILMALCSLLIGSRPPQASPFSSELPGPGFCTSISSHELQPVSASSWEACLSWGVAHAYAGFLLGLPVPPSFPVTTQPSTAHPAALRALWPPYLLFLWKLLWFLFSQSQESLPRPPVFRSHVTPSSSVSMFPFPKSNLHCNYSCLARQGAPHKFGGGLWANYKDWQSHLVGLHSPSTRTFSQFLTVTPRDHSFPCHSCLFHR